MGWESERKFSRRSSGRVVYGCVSGAAHGVYTIWVQGHPERQNVSLCGKNVSILLIIFGVQALSCISSTWVFFVDYCVLGSAVSMVVVPGLLEFGSECNPRYSSHLKDQSVVVFQF